MKKVRGPPMPYIYHLQGNQNNSG